MSVQWQGVWNRLFKMMDSEGPTYYSGGQFIRAVHEIDPYFGTYTEYINERTRSGASTTRRDYYRDIFMSFREANKFKFVSHILSQCEAHNPSLCAEIRAMMLGGTIAPSAAIPAEVWSAERLNDFLKDIDAAIASGQFDRAVTLSYTCLEGFFGAFVRAKLPGPNYPNEVIELSKMVRDYLKSVDNDIPGEALNLITRSAHAVDKSRNRFSESHFAGEAGRWLAVYMRDVLNTQIRLLLHFM